MQVPHPMASQAAVQFGALVIRKVHSIWFSDFFDIGDNAATFRPLDAWRKTMFVHQPVQGHAGDAQLACCMGDVAANATQGE